MEYTPDRDGMAWLSLYIPAHQASAIWNRTTALARGLQSPDEPRTMTQLRPDIAAHLLLAAGQALTRTAGTSTEQNTTGQGNTSQRNPGEGNPGQGNAVRTHDGDQDTIGLASLAPADLDDSITAAAVTATADHQAPATAEYENASGNGYADLGNVPMPKVDVLITVPVFALLGLTDEPANLDGYGPVPASMARKLVTDGASSFYRVLVDPRDGAPLEIGRTSYRLTKAMKKALQLRDGKCTFPGCNNHSLDNDTDHLTAWHHGGNTGISNLAQLCPKHHRLKHNSPWEPTPATHNEPPGWTSPTGRTTNPNNPTPNHHNGHPGS
jgi:hypothetical protein